jgi:hypothetical protein
MDEKESVEKPPLKMVSPDYTDLRNYMPELSFNNFNPHKISKFNSDVKTPSNHMVKDD